MSDNEPIIPSGEHIKRLTWVDAYPIAPEEQKYKPFLDSLVHNNSDKPPSTKDLVRTINKTAFDAETPDDARKFLLRFKGWIARGVLEHGLSSVFDPAKLDEYAKEYRESSRNSRNFDNYSGTQRGVYTYQNLFSWLEGPVSYRREDEPYEKPGNFEYMLVNRIRELLDIKSDKPVVMVDFGGVQGISMLRIAKLFSRQIDEGSLAIVVTNLSADKQTVWEFIDKDIYSPKDKEWIKAAFEKVHYVQSDAEELKDIVIQTPGGGVKLGGNVDIIHESSAISTHGFRNDFDFPALADCLSENGMLVINRHPMNEATPLDSETKSTKDKDYEFSKLSVDGYDGVNGEVKPEWKTFTTHDPWQLKAKLAIENLEKKGLVLQDSVNVHGEKKMLSHSFFVKQGAIPITVYDELGSAYRTDN